MTAADERREFCDRLIGIVKRSVAGQDLRLGADVPLRKSADPVDLASTIRLLMRLVMAFHAAIMARDARIAELESILKDRKDTP